LFHVASQAKGATATKTNISNDVLSDYFNYITPAKGYYKCAVYGASSSNVVLDPLDSKMTAATPQVLTVTSAPETGLYINNL